MKSITTDIIVAELERRGLQVELIPTLHDADYVLFRQNGTTPRFIRGTTTDNSSIVGYRLTDDKFITGQVAEMLSIPTPKTILYKDEAQALAFLNDQGKIVVKPLDAAHGNGVTVDVTSAEKLQAALARAQQFSDTIVLQQQVQGRDLRLLMIGVELCAAAERRPAQVVGDGTKNLKQLIEATNQQPDRGISYQKKYNIIPVEIAAAYLGERFEREVPKADEAVQVVGTANIGTGGTARDVTDELPAGLIQLAQRMAGALQLAVCGIDFIDGPNGAFLIEVNASPSLGLHQFPHEGPSRDVGAVFVDWLLKKG